MISRRIPPPPPAATTKRRSRTWAAIAICAAVYLYAFPYQPEVNNPNENVRFFMTAAIVDEGTYAIDAIRARWGWVNDAAVYEGHVYSVKAPGTSLMGVPGYWLYRRWCDLRGAPLDRTTALWVVRMSAPSQRWKKKRNTSIGSADALIRTAQSAVVRSSGVARRSHHCR